MKQLSFLQDSKEVTETEMGALDRNMCELNGLCTTFYTPIKRKCILKLLDVGVTPVLRGNVKVSQSDGQSARASDLIHFKPCMYRHMRGRKRKFKANTADVFFNLF